LRLGGVQKEGPRGKKETKPPRGSKKRNGLSKRKNCLSKKKYNMQKKKNRKILLGADLF